MLIISAFGHGAFVLTGIAVSKDDNPYNTNFFKDGVKILQKQSYGSAIVTQL